MFTVLGSSGFIGSELLRTLKAHGHDCQAPSREDLAGLIGRSAPDLGHVIYCIGLTADFRDRPYATLEAHVSLLARLLQGSRFQSFLYLSSTRVYQGAQFGREEQDLRIAPTKPADLYNVTKLMGESLCLGFGRPDVRVVRLANIYGKDFHSENFLASVIRAALNEQFVRLFESRRSARDYIAVDEVVELMEKIALRGVHRLYNLASGRAISNDVILDRLEALTGCNVTYNDDAPLVERPAISVERIATEFDFCADRLEDRLSDLLKAYREELGSDNRD